MLRASSSESCDQRAGRGQRERAAGADRGDFVLRLDHVAVAGDDEQLLRVADQQQRFEAAQVAVRPPVLRQLDRGAREVAVLLQLAFEALEQREGIGRAAGKARRAPCRCRAGAPCARCPS